MRPGTWIVMSALTVAVIGAAGVAVDRISQPEEITLTAEQWKDLSKMLDEMADPPAAYLPVPRPSVTFAPPPKPTWEPLPVPTELLLPAPSPEKSKPPELVQDCTPGYDPCLPPAYDYDCFGGIGDGPFYSGMVYVQRGLDIYDLDRDGNGLGCESASFWGPA